MLNVNKVTLIGRLGKDPIQRSTKKGIAVAHLSLATSRWRKGENASEDGANPVAPIEETEWHRVVAWGKNAETCAQYLKKGQSVYVEGSIRSHIYNGKDGVSRQSFEIHADQVSFLNSARRPAPAEVEEVVTAEAVH